MRTLRRFLPILATLGAAPLLMAPEFGGNITLQPRMQNLYNINSCMQINQNIVDRVCCRRSRFGNCTLWATRGRFDYWEPAAIVEVTCRSGFSHLQPGLSPRDGGAQSCRTGPNWFFEAHVWASSGRANGDRTAAGGSSFRENTMRCQADPTTGSRRFPNGYGIKHEGVSFNSSGPGGSSRAYISENDPSWARQQGQFRQQQACDPQNPTLEACWGDPTTATGWVTHPNQAVAAALAGYRALGRAMATRTVVTPRQGGWRMSMDYPFIMNASPAAQSMGLAGGGGGRQQGSACFMPGHPGPAWYTAGRANVMPNAMTLRQGQSGQAAHVPDGVYIFTYWVRTGCVVYSNQWPITCTDRFTH